MAKTIAFIGTWGMDIHGGDKGKEASEGGVKTFLVGDDGHLTQVANASSEVNAGILCISPDKQYLYATDERKDWQGIGGNGGGVCAYRIHQEDGSLQFLNAVSSAGAYPCYIAIDATGRYVFACNHANHEDMVTKSERTEEGYYRAVRTFDEGSVGMFPILEDGRVGECCDLKVLKGSSVKEWFQWTPHPHSVRVDPSNTFLLCCDKGSDKIYVYRIAYERGKLEEAYVMDAEPGSGPRHMAFHPQLPFVYVNNELDSTVDSYRFDTNTGKLEHIARAKTIPMPYIPPDPNDHFAENATADIRVHRTGKYLYVSNRGHNSVACFALDEQGGILPMERVSSGGEVPRAIQFDLTGDLLYTVNQRSGNIEQFRVDAGTGALSSTSYGLQLMNPVCMEFLSLDP